MANNFIRSVMTDDHIRYRPKPAKKSWAIPVAVILGMVGVAAALWFAPTPRHFLPMTCKASHCGWTPPRGLTVQHF